MKAQTLTTGQKIENTTNPEWGEFTVMSEYAEGIYEIRGRSGDRLLFGNEVKFWTVK